MVRPAPPPHQRKPRGQLVGLGMDHWDHGRVADRRIGDGGINATAQRIALERDGPLTPQRGCRERGDDRVSRALKSAKRKARNINASLLAEPTPVPADQFP